MAQRERERERIIRSGVPSILKLLPNLLSAKLNPCNLSPSRYLRSLVKEARRCAEQPWRGARRRRRSAAGGAPLKSTQRHRIDNVLVVAMPEVKSGDVRADKRRIDGARG